MDILPGSSFIEKQPPEQDGEQNQQRSENKTNKKSRSVVDDLKEVKKVYDKLSSIAQPISGPKLALILCAIFIAIIIIYFLDPSGGGMSSGGDDSTTKETSTNSQTTPTIPGLTIKLTGPPESGNGRDIVYEVTVDYDPAIAKTPIENIVLVDVIPNTATFVSTDGVQAADSTPTTVTWSLKDPANQKLFHVTLHPKSDDVYVINSVTARLLGSSSGNGSSSDPQAFLDLLAGQGRNTAVLGDRTKFITTIIANSSGLSLGGKESNLGEIYDTGIKYNVNPLILASIWGVESGFDPGGVYPFGCLNPQDAGFFENVSCAAGSLNQLMSTFETHNTAGSLEIPSTTGNTCIYTDPFIYAYEMYTPVCHASDSNDAARTNFVSFYNKVKGL